MYIIMMQKEVYKPIIVSIRDLRNTNEISGLAHKKQEPFLSQKMGIVI